MDCRNMRVHYNNTDSSDEQMKADEQEDNNNSGQKEHINIKILNSQSSDAGCGGPNVLPKANRNSDSYHQDDNSSSGLMKNEVSNSLSHLKPCHSHD